LVSAGVISGDKSWINASFVAQFFFQLFDASLQGNDPRCLGIFLGAKKGGWEKGMVLTPLVGAYEVVEG